jgi:hypothetical protein
LIALIRSWLSMAMSRESKPGAVALADGVFR